MRAGLRAARRRGADAAWTRCSSGFDELADGNDHFEFYWFPHTERALTKRNNRVPAGEPCAPVPRVRGWVDDELLSNTVFGWTQRLTARRARAITGRVNNVRGPGAVRPGVRRRVVPGVLLAAAGAVPRDGVRRAARGAGRRAALDRRRGSTAAASGSPFPVEVRVAAADDIWLSTAYERATAYVAVHQFHAARPRAVLPGRRVDRRRGRRPAALGQAALPGQRADCERLYPRFADWREVRARLDPAGVFANAYLDRVVGPAS